MEIIVSGVLLREYPPGCMNIRVNEVTYLREVSVAPNFNMNCSLN